MNVRMACRRAIFFGASLAFAAFACGADDPSVADDNLTIVPPDGEAVGRANHTSAIVQLRVNRGRYGSARCAGFFVSERKLVTSASCLRQHAIAYIDIVDAESGDKAFARINPTVLVHSKFKMAEDPSPLHAESNEYDVAVVTMPFKSPGPVLTIGAGFSADDQGEPFSMRRVLGNTAFAKSSRCTVMFPPVRGRDPIDTRVGTCAPPDESRRDYRVWPRDRGAPLMRADGKVVGVLHSEWQSLSFVPSGSANFIDVGLVREELGL